MTSRRTAESHTCAVARVMTTTHRTLWTCSCLASTTKRASRLSFIAGFSDLLRGWLWDWQKSLEKRLSDSEVWTANAAGVDRALAHITAHEFSLTQVTEDDMTANAAQVSQELERIRAHEVPLTLTAGQMCRLAASLTIVESNAVLPQMLFPILTANEKRRLRLSRALHEAVTATNLCLDVLRLIAAFFS